MNHDDIVILVHHHACIWVLIYWTCNGFVVHVPKLYIASFVHARNYISLAIPENGIAELKEKYHTQKSSSMWIEKDIYESPEERPIHTNCESYWKSIISCNWCTYQAEVIIWNPTIYHSNGESNNLRTELTFRSTNIRRKPG